MSFDIAYTRAWSPYLDIAMSSTPEHGLHIWTLRCLVHQSMVSISGYCFNRFYLGTTTAFGQSDGPENTFHLLPHLIEL